VFILGISSGMKLDPTSVGDGVCEGIAVVGIIICTVTDTPLPETVIEVVSMTTVAEVVGTAGVGELRVGVAGGGVVGGTVV
jgi:hypothetical protein